MFDWLTNIWSRNNARGTSLRIPAFGSVSGETVNNKTANSVSAYYAAIRNVSEDVGKLPSPVYKVDSVGNKTLAKEHPAYKLLMKRPNPMMTTMTFKELLNSWAQGWGNGFAEITFDAKMNPIALWPIHPARVEPWVNNSSELYYYVYPDYDIRTSKKMGDPIVLADWQMIHLKGQTEFGVWGRSILESMTESLGISISSQKYGAAFYGNGTHAGGVLKHPAQLSEEAGQRLKASFEDNHRGASKAGGTLLLEEGMDWISTTVNPRDAQALELRKFQVEEIARWFRIQPHKLQDLSNATYSNIESQNLDYVTDTLLSWTTRFEQELQTKLLMDDDNYVIDFNFNFLLKGDRAARASFYNTLHFMGAMNVNEVRKAEDMNSIGPKGDEYYQQSAMIPLGAPDSNQAQAFDSVVSFTAKKIATKELKACLAEKKKDRDHLEWALSFWTDQLEFCVSSFLPIITTMSQLKLVDGPKTIERFSKLMESAYQGRDLTPVTAKEIMEFFNASKR